MIQAGRTAQVGVVVIGRNEGERLRACLTSVCRPGLTVVYVDSGSSDGSAALAQELGSSVVELDVSRPFSAARARNEGLDRLRQIAPDAPYVQFVDGDCAVVDGWIEAAVAFLNEHAKYAVVCGRRRERYPETSIYNRICDIEWNTGVGDANACGGDALMRVEALSAVEGYDPTVVAGEEPELCLRLRRAGWRIRRLDHEMTLHDAAITRFGQWWKRAIRGGYGGTDVSVRFEKGAGDFSRQIRSARLWAIGWPVGSLIVIMSIGIAWRGAAALAAVAACAIVFPLQVVRVGMKVRQKEAFDFRTRCAYGLLIMLSKWASLQGQWRYLRDRWAGRHHAIIEYKQPQAVVHASK